MLDGGNALTRSRYYKMAKQWILIRFFTTEFNVLLWRWRCISDCEKN